MESKFRPSGEVRRPGDPELRSLGAGGSGACLAWLVQASAGAWSPTHVTHLHVRRHAHALASCSAAVYWDLAIAQPAAAKPGLTPTPANGAGPAALLLLTAGGQTAGVGLCSGVGAIDRAVDMMEGHSSRQNNQRPCVPGRGGFRGAGCTRAVEPPKQQKKPTKRARMAAIVVRGVCTMWNQAAKFCRATSPATRP